VALQAASPNASAARPARRGLPRHVKKQPAPDGRLSGDATAGKDRIFPLTLHNTGTASARAVKLDASAPSG